MPNWGSPINRGNRKKSVVFISALDIDLDLRGPILEQQLNKPKMPTRRRCTKRIAVPTLSIYVRPPFEQYFGDRRVSFIRSGPEWATVVDLIVIDLGSLIEQHRDNLYVPCNRSCVKCAQVLTVAVVLPLSVNIRTLIDQQFDDVRVPSK